MDRCICLARQGTEQLPNKDKIEDIKKGGYILYQNCEDNDINLIVISTGSEVSSSLLAIKNNNIKNIRLVSMPCIEFLKNKVIHIKIMYYQVI